MNWLIGVVLLYALAMLGGGIGGYVTAQSLPSLIAGLVSGVLLVTAAALAKTNPRLGFGLAGLTAAGLVVVFTMRYLETGKPMPSLGLVGLSVFVLALLGVGHLQESRK